MKSDYLVLFHAIALAVGLSLTSGCVQWFTAKTTAFYRVLPDGTKEISYSSDKEQIGLDVDLEQTAKNLKVKIKVEKSSTQEAAIAASLQLSTQALKLIETLAVQAATKGVVGGGALKATPALKATEP